MTETYEAAGGSDGLPYWWGPAVMPLVCVAITCVAGTLGE